MKKIISLGFDTLSNYVVLMLRIFVGIISLPVLLGAYGKELYGIYLLSFGLIATFSFLDLGSGKAIVRYTAEYYRDRNLDKFTEAGSFTLSIYLLGVAVVLLILISLALSWSYIFTVDEKLETIGNNLFLLSVPYGFLTFIKRIPESILEGYRQFVPKNAVEILVSLVQLGGVYFVYQNNLSIIGYATLIIGAATVALFLKILLVWTKLGTELKGIRLIKSLGKILQSEYFQYSKSLFYSSLISIFSQQFDKIILSVIVGVGYVSVYQVVTKPFYVLKNLINQTYRAIQPRLAGYGEEELQATLTKVTKVSLWLFTPVIFTCIIVLDDLLVLWMRSSEYQPYVVYGQLALITLLIKTSFTGIYRAMVISERNLIIPRIEAIAVGVNLLASIVLTHFLTVGGVIIGTLLQFVISAKMIGQPKINQMGMNLLSTVGVRYGLSLVVTIVLVVIGSGFLQNTFGDLTSLLVLLGVSGVTFFLLLLVQWIFASSSDKQLIRQSMHNG